MNKHAGILARDRAARRAAQTVFDRPLVVEAGAGTGKTAVLVARIVAWAMGPGWEASRAAARESLPWEPNAEASESIAGRVLDAVVAITFTEAAAAEMEERVAAALASIEREELPVWLEPSALPPVGEDRRLRARTLLATLDRLQVSTIHGYCRRLLARHPLEAGLHPSFTVDAELTAVPKVADEIVERAIPRLYGDEPDSAALFLAAEGIGPGQLAEAVSKLAADAVPQAALAADPFDDEARDTVVRHLRGALETFLGTAGIPLARTSQTSRRTLETLDRLRALAARIPRTPPSRVELDRLCLDLAVERDSGQLSRVREWATTGCNATERKAVGEEGAATVVAEATVLWSVLDSVSRLRPTTFGHARAVLAPLLAEVTAELRRRGVVPFQGLLVAARSLLTRRPDVLRRERERIIQLLVDEFQDTDPVQCDVLRLLARPGEGGPFLFIVGDPKQSIYGWRSADLAAYESFVAELLEGGEPHVLAQSFRSVPPILEEVERIVAPIMVERAGVQPQFQPLIACPARAEAEVISDERHGPVEYWVCWDPDQAGKTPGWRTLEIEAAAIASDLRALHDSGRLAWKDAAILVRTSTELPEILEALKAQGVPFVVERDRSYYKRREVIEAAAFVRCVVDPSDQLALVTTLRSTAAGVPDAALVPLWRRHLPDAVMRLRGDDPEALEGLRELVAAAAASLPDGVPGLERVNGWEEVLLAFLASLGRLRRSFAEEPADAFVERLRRESLAEPCEAVRYLGAFRLANLDRFYRRLAEGLEETGDPGSILRLLRTSVAEAQEAEEARPGQTFSDAVAVMTVHRAKGLDFPHVYVAQVHRGGRPDRDPKVDAAEAGGGTELVLFGAPTPGWQRVREHRAETATAEMVRTLYVAVTRARDRLVISGGLGLARLAPSFASLLAARPGVPDLSALAGERVAVSHQGGALWLFPALFGDTGAAGRRTVVPWPIAPERASADGIRLSDARRTAALHQKRPFREAASAASHRLLEDDLEPSRGAAGADPRRGEAAAVGTAVHRFLELFDFNGDSGDEIARGRRRLREELSASPGFDSAAVERGVTVLERILAGGLWARFLSLRHAIIARELSVVLPPAEGDWPVGFVAGILDLVYRDPATGELVVADFKTDAVEGDDLKRRTEIYALQGGCYTRALCQALGLKAEPRFEIWYLAAERIVTSPRRG